MIKLSQSRPPMEMHVQRQLSKNVVQHPTLGHHRPAWLMEQLLGACSSCLDTAGRHNGCCSFLPSFGISQQAHNRHIASACREPGSLPPPTQRSQLCGSGGKSGGPGPALLPCTSKHFSAIYAASELRRDGARHPGRKRTYHKAACSVLLSPSASEGSY